MLWWPRRATSPMHSDILTRRLSSSPAHLAPVPLPSPREAHFWYVVPNEVKDVSLLKHYQELLSPCERQSILSMKEDTLQKRALLSRALVRTTIARSRRLCEEVWMWINCVHLHLSLPQSSGLDTDYRMSPRSLKFKKNRFGKPEVEWQDDDNWIPPSLHFNVSHTSSLIACGVTLDVPIGIDVEEKQRKPSTTILSVARRYFSPSEVEFLNAFLDPESQRREFIKLWTLKEAYVKALGRGLAAAPLRDFTIRFEASEGKQVLSDPESDGCHQLFPEAVASKIVVEVSDGLRNLTTNWQFALFELDNSHYAAVCVESDGNSKGGESDTLKLNVRKTIPFVEDERIFETDAAVDVAELS